MRAQVMLGTYKPRKDGTCNIKIYVGFEGDRKYFKTKFHVLPSQFDNKKGLVKRTHPNHMRINALIGEERKRILDHLMNPGGSLRTIGKQKRESFIDFLVTQRDEIKNGFTSLRPSTARNYTSLITRLNQFRSSRKIKDLYFKDIDMTFYKDFQQFLHEECNCGLVGFGKHIKVIKTVMRNAQDLGLHNNEIYKSRLFKRHRGKVAYCHTNQNILITYETSEPTRKSKVKIPDVCDNLNVTWLNTIGMFRDLGEEV